MRGFLGTGATFQADLVLMLEIAMGLALLVGMFLARAKRFQAHKICQTSVMLLNLVAIALVMVPSFRAQVAPQIPAGLGDSYYLVAGIHAGLGTLAELLGLYVVLVAATQWIPERLRFQNWRLWMRTTLAVWWAVILLGVGTYMTWYAVPQAKTASPPSAQATEQPTVKISNFEFTPREITVPENTTVRWVNEGGRHNVQADDGSFKSPTLMAGDRFEHKFEKPGTYPYHCSFHGDKGGKDMAGVVKVVKK